MTESERGSKQSTNMKTKSSRSSKAVQGTNDSSIRSKWSAAIRGYFDDEFLAEICRSGIFPNSHSSCIRTPVINRGYWVRVHAVNHVMTTFLDFFSKSSKHTQIISLGAGYDSTFFKLSSNGHLGSCCYIEVDFPELLKKKLAVIQKNEKLSKFVPLLSESNSADKISQGIISNSPNYKMIGVDLNDRKMLEDLLRNAGVDFKRPTLLLSEVVLVYLNSESSSDLIRWAADSFSDAAFLTYEQICPDDAFGTFMCQHFKNIGTSLKSINEFPTVSSQVTRYCSRGWTTTVACDMNYFFNNIIPEFERNRVDSVEMFDEYEEWHLKCSHYILLTAFKGSTSPLRDIVWHEACPSASQTQWIPESITADNIVEIESNGLLACSSSSASNALESHYQWAEIDAKLDEFCRPVSWNRVFGHTCNRFPVSGDSALFVFGGFGERQSVGCHRRLNCGRVIWTSRPTESFEISLFESIYHTCTYLGLNKSVIFGGRTSPGKPSSFVFLFELKKADVADGCVVEQLTKVETSDDGPCPRWRHSAVEYKGSVVIFGGRNSDEKFLDDCWILDCFSWIWKKVQGTGDQPSARHTHSSEVWNSEILVICGLGQKQTPLSSIHLLDMTSFSWRKLPLVGDTFFPRYSHASAVYHDYLILVGGVSLQHSFPLISVVDLTSGVNLNFDLKIPPAAFPTMLHNHRAVVCEKDANAIVLMVVGGGGNCFSFGTHLNEFPLTIKFTLDFIVSRMKSKQNNITSLASDVS